MSNELIAGVGLRRRCAADVLVEVIETAIVAVGRTPSVLAVPAFKREEAGLVPAAQRLGLELVFIEDGAMRAAQPRCVTRSVAAERAVGLASVAEASALAAAGSGGRLLLPRIKGRGTTCAIAERG